MFICKASEILRSEAHFFMRVAQASPEFVEGKDKGTQQMGVFQQPMRRMWILQPL